jgi:GTP pyrophosphokinase
MVTLAKNSYNEIAQNHTPASWLAQLPSNYQNRILLEQAAQLAFITGNQAKGLGEISCWQHGMAMANNLLDLNVDSELLAAALLFPVWNYTNLNAADIEETLSKNIAHLLVCVDKMDDISLLHNTQNKSPAQIENCRKMLLAMAEDLRVVLLKLVERLHALHTARFLPPIEQKKLGEEIFSIYAPLANRLGIGELKWQMEDFAFRIINPEEYKKIAKQLDMKRIEREALIKNTLGLLEGYLTRASLTGFELMGRAKHIYSIHKKMIKKNLTLDQLFDISAVRILVNTIDECYQVLDLIQQHFDMIQSEFNDYISAPKANGYRSIHAAVFSHDCHIIEIQIRTYAMHQESELGVAAHWSYKEGGANNRDYQAKIAWLRELLSWQKEVEAKEKSEKNVLNDRVYVLTPEGDIIDLPQGATPLDFAYTIHSNIGHRCRGAKIDDHIVPLNTPLKMGDRIEILTSKTVSPSRDWLNASLGYLTTARARAKVAHWFRQQDYDQNIINGKTILDRELKRLHMSDIDHETLAHKFDHEGKLAFYASIGANTLRQAQLSGRLETWYKTAPTKTSRTKNSNPDSSHKKSSGILIEGTSYWLTRTARCCQPLPGDAIAGYISQKHGIAIHKINCNSFLARQKQKPERVLLASWGDK